MRRPAEILVGVGDREKTDWQGRKVPEFEGPGVSAKSLGCAEVKHASLSAAPIAEVGLSVLSLTEHHTLRTRIPEVLPGFSLRWLCDPETAPKPLRLSVSSAPV